MAGRLATTLTRSLPDLMAMHIADGRFSEHAPHMAGRALELVRLNFPRLSGWAVQRMYADWGPDYFGVGWRDDYVWYQETGTRAFTMRNLAGKTIPMWVDDPTGVERRRNPKAEIRTTPSGRVQVLIFRRAAKIGSRKQARVQTSEGVSALRDVPMSYPGAPGRIVVREAPWPHTAPGRVGGRIAQGNVGVRWRHPGVIGRGVVEQSLITAAKEFGMPPAPVQALNQAAGT